MAHARMPRITRRLGSVCQDTGRPRSDLASHGADRTMAQRYSATAPLPSGIADGASDQSARIKGLRSARPEHPVSPPLTPRFQTSFPVARSSPLLAAHWNTHQWARSILPSKNSRNFHLIGSDTTDPLYLSKPDFWHGSIFCCPCHLFFRPQTRLATC
jgi:hypothetical protein